MGLRKLAKVKLANFFNVHYCQQNLSRYHIYNAGKRPLLFQVPETKIAEFANSIDLNEVAYNEPLHLDLQFVLYCLA